MPAAPSRSIPADPAWPRRLTVMLATLVLLWPLMRWSEFRPWILFDAQSLHATGRFLATFFPPAHTAEFLRGTAIATWETIAIASAGMSIALLIAIPLTLAATERLSVSRIGTGRMRPLGAAVRALARALLIALRSVPELVWALLFVRIVGLGPTAGVLAIGLTYGGMLGKVYAEILESTEPHATEALLRNGGGRLGALLYGALPDAAPELVSYSIYRWECAIRGSVVMGFVGAGGLGQRMDESLRMLAGGEVATMLIVFVLLVACADGISRLLRRRLA